MDPMGNNCDVWHHQQQPGHKVHRDLGWILGSPAKSMEKRFFETCFFWGAQWYWQFWHALDKYWNTCFFLNFKHMCIFGICLFSYKEIDWMIQWFDVLIYFLWCNYPTSQLPLRWGVRLKVQQSVLVRRRPALMSMETVAALWLVVYPIMYKVLYIPRGCLRFPTSSVPCLKLQHRKIHGCIDN